MIAINASRFVDFWRRSCHIINSTVAPSVFILLSCYLSVQLTLLFHGGIPCFIATTLMLYSGMHLSYSWVCKKNKIPL